MRLTGRCLEDTHGVYNEGSALLQQFYHGLGPPRGGGLPESLGQLGVPAGDHGEAD